MTDEVLGAVDHEIAARQYRGGLHAPQVGARLRLGHGETFDPLATHRRQQIPLPLLAFAGEQDVGGSRHAGVMQHVAGVAELLLVQHPGHRVEPRAAHLGRHVGGIEARIDRLRLELLQQLLAQVSALLHLLLVRHELPPHEIARGLDDELLLFAE